MYEKVYNLVVYLEKDGIGVYKLEVPKKKSEANLVNCISNKLTILICRYGIYYQMDILE